MFTSPDSHAAPAARSSSPCPLAMVVTMIFGLILGAPTLRLRGDYLAIVTLGFGEIIRHAGEQRRLPLSGQRRLPERRAPSRHVADGSRCSRRRTRIAVVLARAVAHHHRDRDAGRQPGAQPCRASLGGHPGGRGRRRADGRADLRFKLWAFASGRRSAASRARCSPGRSGSSTTRSSTCTTSVLFLAAVVLGGSGNKVGVHRGRVRRRRTSRTASRASPTTST